MRPASCLLLAVLASACPAPKAQETAPPVVRGQSTEMVMGLPAAPAVAAGAPAPVVGGDKPLLPSGVVVSGLPPASALPPQFEAAADTIAAAVQGRTRAWELLAVLSDSFGHRLSGSRALERAIDWSIEQMKRDGLENARREKVMVPRWVRGAERGRVIAPIERDLVLLGLGGTVGGKVSGEVVVLDALDEVATRGEALRGKIVVINQAMPRFDHGRNDTHYGDTVRIRSSGASAAARFGAKAVLIRSVTANSLRSPHTGAVRYEDGVPKIPAAAITLEDAELLARLARRGPTRVELSLGARTLPDSESGNAIAELRGRELPDEIVLIGGHIDSWDVGDGSTDDGAGCMMAIEAAALLKELGLVPRRTIRVVLFTNEENGLRGAKAYHAAHGKERHVAAIEADSGSGAPRGFGIGGTPEQVAELQRYARLFDGLGAGVFESGGGGADISPLTKDGVLGIGLHPDVSGYFDLHHSPADTFDKIDPEHIERNAAAMALMAYILAER